MQLAALDPATLDPAGLMGEISGLAAFISQAQAQLARMTARLDATGGAEEAGHKSASAFLRAGCGLAPGRAGEVIAAGRGLPRLPATAAALEAGTISFDQAQIILRTTAPMDDEANAALAEQVLLDHAPGLDPSRLRRFAEEVAYRLEPDRVEQREKKRWERRYLSFGLTLDHTGVLAGACGDTVSYEILRTAAETFAPPAGQLDDRTAAQRRMDGLVAACKAALDSGAAPERHGSVPHVSILVHDETLAQAAARASHSWPSGQGRPTRRVRTSRPSGRSGPGGCGASAGQAGPGRPGESAGPTTLDGQAGPGGPGESAGPTTLDGQRGQDGHTTPDGLGEQVSSGEPTGRGRLAGAPPGQTGHGSMLTARQVLALCCGAQITAIRWRDGLPLDVGRTARTEPSNLRRALEARDRTCRWPGCRSLALWATAHHIGGWINGASTSLGDLVLLCHTHHHHFIHHLGWTITGNPNGTLHFTHPGGWLTLDSPLPGLDRIFA